MDNFKIIKSISKNTCPHCGKSIFIGSQTMIPVITKVIKPSEIQEAKEKVKKKITEEVVFKSQEDKEKALQWIETAEFSNSDVEDVVNNIKLSQQNEEGENNDNK